VERLARLPELLLVFAHLKEHCEIVDLHDVAEVGLGDVVADVVAEAGRPVF
jgi:hypothetical protein